MSPQPRIPLLAPLCPAACARPKAAESKKRAATGLTAANMSNGATCFAVTTSGETLLDSLSRNGGISMRQWGQKCTEYRRFSPNGVNVRL